MTVFQLTLFGPPRLEHDGNRVEIDTRKAIALLAYLVLNKEEHSRETLAALLWPDQNEKSARSSLRRALWTIRQVFATDSLDGDKQTVIFRRPQNLVVDVLDFQTLISSAASSPEQQLATHIANLQAAVDLYRADFLAGFTLPDSSTFDDWQFFVAENLRRTLMDGLHQLVRWFTQTQDYMSASEYARRLLALDPLHEPVHRTLMQLYAWSDLPSAALRQYEDCRSLLEEELGVPPEEETSQLYEAIRMRKFPLPLPIKAHLSPVSANDSLLSHASIRHNLSFRIRPLVGRDTELAKLDMLMFDRDERLITITGPGGIGKTVLALAAAKRYLMTERYRDGVFVVSLATIDTVTTLLSALMAALALPPETTHNSESALKRQVIDYLRNKQMLIIFDNFEQLLDGRNLLIEILIAAPDIQIFVTSRERLHIQDEQVFPISGLECPATIADSTAPALILFLQSAQRIQPYLQTSKEDIVHIVRICHLVHGMPLALELAAGWINVLTPSMIADAILSNLDILQTTLRDGPARHRSIRAVLDGTWTLLAEDERRIFTQLSVFRGGFNRTAAQQIAGATVNQLNVLVEKSLIEYWRTADRFEMHELLRQYSEEKLQETGQLTEIQRRHCAYYAHYMQVRHAALSNAQQTATMTQLMDEINNLRIAWNYAVLQLCFRDIRLLAEGLQMFYELSNLLQEGATTFRQASEILRTVSMTSTESQRALGFVLGNHGYFSFRQGNFALSMQLLEESMTILRPTGDQTALVFSSLWLGVISILINNYQAGEHWLAECLYIHAQIGLDWGQWMISLAFGIGAHTRGAYLEAKQHFRKSLAYCRKSGDPRATTNCLSFSSRTYFALGEYVEAKVLLQECLSISQACNDTFSIATALNHLGMIEIQQFDHSKGQAWLQESASLFETLGDRWSQARALNDLAASHLDTDNFTAARAHYRRALQISVDAHIPPYALTAILGLAELTSLQEQPVQAMAQLILVEGHTQSTPETRERAASLRLKLEVQLLPQQIEQAHIYAQQLTIETATTEFHG